jgi:hypothetical protein
LRRRNSQSLVTGKEIELQRQEVHFGVSGVDRNHISGWKWSFDNFRVWQDSGFGQRQCIIPIQFSRIAYFMFPPLPH